MKNQSNRSLLKKFLTSFSLLSVVSFTVYGGPSVVDQSNIINEESERITENIRRIDSIRERISEQEFKETMLRSMAVKKEDIHQLTFPRYDFTPLSVNEDYNGFNVATDNIAMSVSQSAGSLIFFQSGSDLSANPLAQREMEFEISLPNRHYASNAQAMHLTTNNSLVHLDYNYGTDVVVQAFNDSARILTVIQDSMAPQEFVYEISLPQGGILKRDQETGSIVIFNGENEYIGSISAPWAMDNSGNAVATEYEIQGNTLVQNVYHRGQDVDYPIIADPWLGFDLIDSATWVRKTKGWTFSVKPTGWARANGGGYLPGLAGWNELYARYKNRGLNTNLGGMKDQFICHHQAAFLKSRWNLDEWRPDVSYAATVAALCNP